MYTPVPLLALLALLAAALGLVNSPQAQGIVHTLLVATLGASVVHLLVLAGSGFPVLVTPGLILICATILSFAPRFSQITPVLFLVFILTTLGVTLATRPKRALTLTPAPHTSFEKPFPTPRHTPPDLYLLLSAQLSYTLAAVFCIPPALRSPGPESPLVVSLISVRTHLSSTYIFRILDTVFTVLALLSVFAAYYRRSRYTPRHDIEQAQAQTSTPKRAPTIPRRPNITLLSPPASPTPTPSDSDSDSKTPTHTSSASATPPFDLDLPLPPGTRISPSPARNPIVVVPLPVLAAHKERAASWAPADGDFMDLRDPFASTSAMARWADADAGDGEGRRRTCDEYAYAYGCGRTTRRTRMSTWGRLPGFPSRRGVGRGRGMGIDTGPGPGLGSTSGKVRFQGRLPPSPSPEGEEEEDAWIAQRLLVQLGSGGGGA